MMKALQKNKIAIFVCNDLIGLLILNKILPGIKNLGLKPVIYHTGDHRNRTFKIPTPPVVSFFNTTLTRDILIPTLERMPISSQKNLTFRQLASRYEIEFKETSDINDHQFLAEIIKDEEFCGGIALRFLQVFGSAAISIFHEKGFLWNLHSGLLPKYKGLLTPFRAIENGDETYGMTLHDLTAGIDEGDIIQLYELPLRHTRPILDLYMDTVPVGIEMILSNLTDYKEKGYVEVIPQTVGATRTYYSNPTAQEFRNYMMKGILYADPYFTIERIISLFTEAGSQLQVELKRAMLMAISNAIPHPTSSLNKEEDLYA
jgi:Formyl transferase